MVNKHRRIKSHEAPPPMDETWWEAVLAEDEANYSPHPEKNIPQALMIDPGGNRSANNSDPGPQVNQFTTDWEKAHSLFDNDQVISLLVTGYNRGGLLVNGEGLQGFVPLSHLVNMPCQVTDPEKWLQTYLERTLSLKIIECDQERGRVVFSERAAQAKPGSRLQLLETLKPGDCVFGIVTNITEFGIFIDLGGIEGLVHVSEISWGRVRHPVEVVTLGEQVKVFVIQVEQERSRVALSLKRLYQNPWETADMRYARGQVTEAIVTSVVPFGAFARLEEGLDGLIHISEMDCEETGSHPRDILHEGQRIQVRILHVDAARQRLGLSLKTEVEYTPTSGEII
jgi:small subunit ribosomal protein S1